MHRIGPAGRARDTRRLELADIVRTHGAAFRRTHALAWAQRRALDAIATCRTATLGGHREVCESCGGVRITYNSCRNRHCPKCQTLAQERWLEARRAELLPVEYFHVVFTLPHDVNALAQGNPAYSMPCSFARRARRSSRSGRTRDTSAARSA